MSLADRAVEFIACVGPDRERFDAFVSRHPALVAVAWLAALALSGGLE